MRGDDSEQQRRRRGSRRLSVHFALPATSSLRRSTIEDTAALRASTRAALPENDDEAERALLRERARESQVLSRLITSPDRVASRRRSSVIEPVALAAGADAAATSVLSNAQLGDLYSQVIKLSAENKITQKNSWSLDLIDNLPGVLQSQDAADGPSTTNFQAASCTLDAGVKIYSCRVDSVHGEAYKVLGSLNQTKAGQGGDGTDDDHDDDDGADGEAAGDGDAAARRAQKTRRRQRAASASALEPNPASLIAKELDANTEPDPLFRKFAAAFDEGGASGLLLNNMAISTGVRLVFDSQDAGSGSVQDVPDASDARIDTSDLARLLSASAWQGMRFSPAFEAFRLERAAEHDDEQVSEACALADTLSASMEDATAAPVTSSSIHGRDDADTIDHSGAGGAGGDDDDDDDIDNGFAEDAFVPAESMDFDCQQREQELTWTLQEQGSNEDTGAAPSSVLADTLPGKDIDLLLAMACDVGPSALGSTAAAGFARFGKAVTGAAGWAGPKHWKLRGASAASGGANSTEKAKRSKKKTEFRIDFFDSAFDPTTALGTSRAATQLAARTRANAAPTLLPDDVHYDVDMLAGLFSKPKWRVAWRSVASDHAGASEDGAAGDAVVAYDYHNDNDMFNYCADRAGHDDDDDDDDHDNGIADDNNSNMDSGVPTAALLPEGTMVAAPVQPDRLDVSFARVAKKVDVRKLKASVWTRLNSLWDADTKENEDPQREAVAASQPVKPGGVRFQALLDSMDPADPAVSADVSVAYCFICLLHLANENNLMINSTDDMADLLISQDSA